MLAVVGIVFLEENKMKSLHSRLLVLCLLVFSFGFIGNAEADYSCRLGNASYCDYENGFLYYVCAADYKTCSPERRKEYRDYLLSKDGMKARFDFYKNGEWSGQYAEFFDFADIDFFDVTSNYVVMKVYNIHRKDDTSNGFYAKIYDKLGQPIESKKIAEADFWKVFEMIQTNEDIDVMKLWNSLKKKK